MLSQTDVVTLTEQLALSQSEVTALRQQLADIEIAKESENARANPTTFFATLRK